MRDKLFKQKASLFFMKGKYDLIIIGAGPAGLSAAIYAARYKLKTLVIGKIPGGLASEAPEVQNYPGVEKLTGMKLMLKMIAQVKELQVEIKNENVVELKSGFEVITSKGNYLGKNIIIATGSERKKLGVKREKELTGRGISYCATCDSGFYKDKIAGVVGGSDAALTAAILLSKFAKKVYIFYRQDKFFRAEQIWAEQVAKTKNIESVFNSKVVKFNGEEKLESVELNSGKIIKLDGLFIEVGSKPNVELVGPLGVEVDGLYIKTDKAQKTNVDGVYAAGDVTNNTFKQIVTACGEGAIAAHSAYEEIRKVVTGSVNEGLRE